jgi:hypothetical protein
VAVAVLQVVVLVLPQQERKVCTTAVALAERLVIMAVLVVVAVLDG